MQSSLLQKCVNYGHKSFITLSPGVMNQHTGTKHNYAQHDKNATSWQYSFNFA